ncbi:MAG: EAL domain-containing protein [Alphaproteobacteria bacterium]|nr:EAL domain-containing protein [Alphaproteobacteria bacterium]
MIASAVFWTLFGAGLTVAAVVVLRVLSDRDDPDAIHPQLREALDHMSDGVVAVDGQGMVRMLNPAAQFMLGCDDRDVIGRPCESVLPGLLEGGELTLRGTDGRTIALDASRAPRAGAGPRLVILRDITERKAAESIDVLMHEINQQVLHGVGLDGIMPFVCETLTALHDLPLVWVGLREPDGSIRVVGAAGEDVERLRALNIRWDEGREAEGPTGRAVRMARTVLARIDDPQWEECLVTVRERGYRAVAAIPLFAQHGVVGALHVYTHDRFPMDALRRLELLAMRLGVAIRIAIDQRNLHLQSAAMEAAANGMVIADRDGRIEWANEAFTRLTGWPLAEAKGRRADFVLADQQPGTVAEWLGSAGWRGETMLARREGGSPAVDLTVTPMRGGDGRVTHYVLVQEDISERKRVEERVRYLANYDPLTALPNRGLFRDRLQHAVARARARGAILAVLFLDLDQFNRINDTLGHAVGDEVLKATVLRMSAAVRSADTLARVGGDEFAMILSDLPNAEAAANAARQVLAAVARPLEVGGNEVHMGASIGISVFPGDGDDADQLVTNADMAMYRAIREAPNSYRFYGNAMNAEVRARMNVERELRRAVGKQEFVLYYQPQVEAASGRIVCLEALVRWRCPDRGLIPPMEFIPVAEESGLILAIGEWVLIEACGQLRQWQRMGLPVVPVAVNVSAAQLRHQDFVARVRGVLADTGLPANLLEMELTESIVMEDAPAAVRLLGELSATGIKLAIDDFGTGYSSLSYLKRFPVDKLKIDKSFVRDLTTDNNDAEIARAIISLGHSLNLKIVSEGVETEGQLNYLIQEGCDVIQGYLFSRPVPAEEVEPLLRRGWLTPGKVDVAMV